MRIVQAALVFGALLYFALAAGNFSVFSSPNYPRRQISTKSKLEIENRMSF